MDLMLAALQSTGALEILKLSIRILIKLSQSSALTDAKRCGNHSMVISFIQLTIAL